MSLKQPPLNNLAAGLALFTVAAGIGSVIAMQRLRDQRVTQPEEPIRLPSVAACQQAGEAQWGLPENGRSGGRSKLFQTRKGHVSRQLCRELADEWLKLKQTQWQEIEAAGIHPETIDIEISSRHQTISQLEHASPYDSPTENNWRLDGLRQAREELAWLEAKGSDGTPMTPRRDLPHQKRLDDIDRILAGDWPITYGQVDWGLLAGGDREQSSWWDVVRDGGSGISRWDVAMVASVLTGLTWLFDRLLTHEWKRRAERLPAAAPLEQQSFPPNLPENSTGSAQVELVLISSPSRSGSGASPGGNRHTLQH